MMNADFRDMGGALRYDAAAPIRGQHGAGVNT